MVNNKSHITKLTLFAIFSTLTLSHVYANKLGDMIAFKCTTSINDIYIQLLSQQAASWNQRGNSGIYSHKAAYITLSTFQQSSNKGGVCIVQISKGKPSNCYVKLVTMGENNTLHLAPNTRC